MSEEMFSEIHSTAKHSVIFGLGRILRSAIGFLLIPLYTRHLSPDDYGILALLSIVASMLVQALGMGLGVSFVRTFNDYLDEAKQTLAYSTAFYATLGAALAGTAALWFLSGHVLPWILPSSEIGLGTVYLRLLSLQILFEVTSGMLAHLFIAGRESLKFIFVSLLRFVAQIVATIYLVVVLRRGVLGVLEGQLLGGLINLLVLLPLCVPKLGGAFSLRLLRQMLSFGLPFVPDNLAWIVFETADRWFLQFFWSTALVGIYALGYKFGQLVEMLLVAPLWLVLVPAVMRIKNQPYAKEYYAKLLTYVVYAGAFLTLSVSTLSREIIEFMAARPFWPAYQVVPLVAASYALYAGSYILETGLILAERSMPILYAQLIGTFVSLVGYALFIPSYGMMGAALATLVGSAALALAKYLFSQREYPLNFEWSRLTKILIVMAALYFISTPLKLDSLMASLALKGGIIFSFPVALYLVGFYERAEVLKLATIVKGFLSPLRPSRVGQDPKV